MTLVTHQTGPQGRIVKRVYIEDGCNIARELYLGAVLDRATSRVTFMASTEGGVEIEEVAATHPGEDHHGSRSTRSAGSCRSTAASSPSGWA